MIRRSVLALFVLSSGLFAQEFRATLTGTVTDPSGAAIPGATVKATSLSTNLTAETKTTADGVYTIPFLDPGVYDVEAIASGFKTFRRTAITLEVSQKLNLSFQLAIGQTNTEVTVVGDQELIETANSDRGLVFDPTKTQELPLNGRQSYMLLTLTPGVIFTQEQFGASGFSGTRGWDVNSSYKFNGARAGNGNNVFLLNGSPISDYGSQWEFAPSIDAIQEFKAITTAYDAQYGHEAGGVVNTTIKSGTNQWHGDVYDYWRNSILDANTFQNNLSGSSKTGHNQHQFGGVAGGPIRKDKDFIFASYEGWQEVIPFPAQGTTVPMDLRNGQNFANYGITIYDPLTTHACGGPNEPCNQSSYWRTPFPGDVIPASRISPVGQKLLSYFPTPNSPGQGAGGITNDFVAISNKGRYWYNQPITRWDHVFGAKDKFYAMYSEFHGYEYRSTTGFPQPAATGNTDNNRTFNGVNLDETHVISSNMVLDFRANYFRFTQLTPGYNSQALGITAQSVGMADVHSPTVSTSVVPNINLSNFSGPVFGSGSYSWSPLNQWDFVPNLSWIKGRHSLHLGFEVQYMAKGNVAPGNAWGTYTFNSTLTRQASDRSLTSTDNFDSIATLLLGIPTAGSIDTNASYYMSRPYYAGYVQDDWRATDRLTFNFGLRYEVQVPALERYNRENVTWNPGEINPLSNQIIANWTADAAQYNATNPKYPFPAAPSAIYGAWHFAGVGGYPRRLYDTDWTNVAPRAGFAYRLNEKTVLRGGAGVYYQSITSMGQGQTGFSATTNYISSLDGVLPSACANNGCQNGPPTGPYSLMNPFPNGLLAPSGSNLGALTNVGNGVSYYPTHYKVPRTYQYNLGIQRQLPKNMVIDIAFSGNYANYGGYGMDMGWPLGNAGVALYNQAIADPTFFTRQVPNPFYNVPGLPVTSYMGSTPTMDARDLMSPFALFDGYDGVTQNNVQKMTFRSDAGQMRFEKRAFADANSAAGVLTWVLSWTFSKELSGINRSGSTGYTWETQLDPLVYQMDSNNKTHEIAFSGVWDLPVGRGRRFGSGVQGVADKMISGWRADYILTYISGFPVGLPNYINYCGNFTNYIDPTTGQATGQTYDHWFNNNKSCYAQFPSNASGFSNLPPRFSGNVENPAAPQLNFAIEKNTTIGERYKLQFRAESFNLTNTPIRPGPSTTLTSSTFGVIPTSQNNFPRLVQLALKLFF